MALCERAATRRSPRVRAAASLRIMQIASCHAGLVAFVLLATSALTGCDSGSTGTDAGSDAGPLTCAAPGMPTAGAPDTHCGSTVQATDQASCFGSPEDAGPEPDAGVADDAGTGPGCEYGATLFGMEGDDDDCKYHVSWTSSSICEGSPGVTFTVVATNKSDGSSVTGAQMRAETFVSIDDPCDEALGSGHTGPGSEVALTESTTTPGTYVGNVAFDQAGQWTIRFHLFELCSDEPEDSPHGHVAFRLTVP